MPTAPCRGRLPTFRSPPFSPFHHLAGADVKQSIEASKQSLAHRMPRLTAATRPIAGRPHRSAAGRPRRPAADLARRAGGSGSAGGGLGPGLGQHAGLALRQRRKNVWCSGGAHQQRRGSLGEHLPPSGVPSPMGPPISALENCVFGERQHIYASWFDGYAKCLLPLCHLLEAAKTP